MLSLSLALHTLEPVAGMDSGRTAKKIHSISDPR